MSPVIRFCANTNGSVDRRAYDNDGSSEISRDISCLTGQFAERRAEYGWESDRLIHCIWNLPDLGDVIWLVTYYVFKGSPHYGDAAYNRPMIRGNCSKRDYIERRIPKRRRCKLTGRKSRERGRKKIKETEHFSPREQIREDITSSRQFATRVGELILEAKKPLLKKKKMKIKYSRVYYREPACMALQPRALTSLYYHP